MKSWGQTARVYLDRRMVVIFFLGFSSGLPSSLVFSNLSIWLSDEGLSRTSIGLFGIVATPYAINFLWAPLIDRLRLPLLTGLLGQRRGWALLTQVALMAAIGSMAMMNPTIELYWLAVSAVAVAIASASQDVVIDAYRIEILESEKYAAGAAVAVAGWMTGAAVGGAGSLYIVAATDWNTAYLIMAGFVSVGMVTVLVCQEPDRRPSIDTENHERSMATNIHRLEVLSGTLGDLASWLYSAAIAPLVDFVRRLGSVAVLILLFIVCYKLGDALLGRMSGVFYRELGFQLIEIANVSKIYGYAATIFGLILGGILANRIGMLRGLLVGGVLMAATNLTYSWLAAVGNNQMVFVIAVISDNLTAGLATSIFVAYLSSLCNVAYTATQYALLASIGNFSRIQFAGISGWMVDSLGGDWVTFFMITAAMALPGLMMLIWMIRRFPPEPAAAGG